MEIFKMFGSIFIKDEATDSLKKMDKQVKKTEKQAKSSFGGIGKSAKKLGAAIGAAFAVGAIVNFSKASVDAANEQIEAEVKLATVLKQRTKATDKQIKSVKRLTSEQQKLGVIGDEVQLAGAQQLATFVDSTDALETLIPAMNNLLAQQNGLNASSGDAIAKGNMLGKVLQGQVGALNEVGISFTEAQETILRTGTEMERAGVLAQVITDNVGNMNEELAKTDSGKIQQAKNTLGDMQEQIGMKLLPILADLTNWFMLNVLPAIQQVGMWGMKIWQDIQPVISEFIETYGPMIAEFFQAIIDFASTFFTNFKAGMEALNPIIQPILQFMGDLFKRIFAQITNGIQLVTALFKGDWKAAWEEVKQIFTNSLNFWRDTFGKVGELIGDGVKFGINKMIDFVEKGLNRVVKSVNKVIRGINKTPGINIPTVPTVNLPQLAKGGVVNRPTIAMIGEDGPEAVVPLSKRNNPNGYGLGGSGMTININNPSVFGMDDINKMGDALVKTLRRKGVVPA